MVAPRPAPYKRVSKSKLRAPTQTPPPPPLPPVEEAQDDVKIIYRPLPYLMFSTLLPLNYSGSKEASVGLDPSDQTFTPYVQIFSKRPRGRYGVCLQSADWTELLRHEAAITAYFANGTSPKSVKFGAFTAAFQVIYGQPTLVISEKSPKQTVFHPDTVALQSSTWDGLMAAKSCINEMLTTVTYTTADVTTRFEHLESYVMDHLRHAVRKEDEDTEVARSVNTFFKQMQHAEPEWFYMDSTIALYCIQLYVSKFKLRQYINDFSI